MTDKRRTNRRNFFQDVSVGAAGMAFASIQSTSDAASMTSPQKPDYVNKKDIPKYEKYFLKEPWGIDHPGTPPDAPLYIGIGQETPVAGWDEPLTQVLRPIYRAYKMIPEGHRHNVAEILYFIGGDPMNFKEFGAEVEFVMGEGDEAETHIITTTTWVYVPANVMHCPLEFKRVDKPIMFGHIMFAPSYNSTVVGKNPLER
jgi:hypothetical protein